MHKLIVLFFMLFFSNTYSMSNSSLSAVLSDALPLHIVTLTRASVDANGDASADSRFYLPISASEAATVFVIMNYFLGDSESDFEGKIQSANAFDQGKKHLASEYIKQRVQDRKARVLSELNSLLTGDLEPLKRQIIAADEAKQQVVPNEISIIF